MSTSPVTPTSAVRHGRRACRSRGALVCDKGATNDPHDRDRPSPQHRAPVPPAQLWRRDGRQAAAHAAALGGRQGRAGRREGVRFRRSSACRQTCRSSARSRPASRTWRDCANTSARDATSGGDRFSSKSSFTRRRRAANLPVARVRARRREAVGAADRAADEDRAGHQPAHGAGDRRDDPAHAAAARHRVDRMKRRGPRRA